MKIFQMSGLSGAGKSTIAYKVKSKLEEKGFLVEVLDGDVFRKNLCSDLGFSQEDRFENIRRMGYVASLLSKNNVVVLISAINPYEKIRNELIEKYQAKTILIDCDINTLSKRDTKGLYKRAFLPQNHIDHLPNLTGVNDVFEVPSSPDLVLNTSIESVEESTEKFISFIIKCLE